MPDVYQGTELWDLSLVDPDNRRPVDYDVRRRLLEKVRSASAGEVLGWADEGAPKLWLIQRALDVRRRHEQAFAPPAAYRPLPVRGRWAHRVVTILRGDDVAVVVPRLVRGLREGWDNTAVELPPGTWADALGDRSRQGGLHPVGPLLWGFPVALLVRN